MVNMIQSQNLKTIFTVEANGSIQIRVNCKSKKYRLTEIKLSVPLANNFRILLPLKIKIKSLKILKLQSKTVRRPLKEDFYL